MTTQEMLDQLEEVGNMAFPCTVAAPDGGTVSFTGMSMRQWYAGQALLGMAANYLPEVAAKRAFEYADAMTSFERSALNAAKV